MKLKKILTTIAVIMVAALSFACVTACTTSEKEIYVIAREDGSGTRDAFDSLIKDEDGTSLATTGVYSAATLLSSTGNVLTTVASNATAIGYVSLGSLNDTVKAISVDGVEASSENVLNGSYSLQRPFVIMTNVDVTLTDATADFLLYLTSSQAQEIVVEAGYVEQASSYTYTAPTTALSGTIVLRGSTSVDPLMVDLIADYISIAGSMVSSVTFDLETTGSSAGSSAVKADTTGNVIGMRSSAVSSSDAAYFNQFDIALDAVAVIVNADNDITNITTAELYAVYTGSTKLFSELGE